MELWLWVTYWSGAAWIFGWPIMLTVGPVIYSWLMIYSIWTLFEMFGGVGDFGVWLAGPVRRAWLGSFIFWLGVSLSTIPGVGILTSWLCGLWAVYDYYDYSYVDGTGPVAPPAVPAAAA